MKYIRIISILYCYIFNCVASMPYLFQFVFYNFVFNIIKNIILIRYFLIVLIVVTLKRGVVTSELYDRV